MDSKSPGGASCSRRFFLGFGLVVAAGSMAATARAALTGPRRLSFSHTHTGEKLSTVYWEKGRYVRGALGQIDYILRDYVNGAERPIDRRLLDMLSELHRRLDSRAPFEIISGYRSPDTNAKLRARSDGVAKHSYHLQAMAIDIRLPDVPLRNLRQAAMDLGRGGVGIYPRSNFVHIDTGPVRYW